MTAYKKIAEMLIHGHTRREIASVCSASPKTITKIKKYISEKKITENDIGELTDGDLQLMFVPVKKYTTKKAMPDLESVFDGILKGATIHRLWEEYADECRASNKEFLSYTRFYEKVQDYKVLMRATRDMEVRPGETCIIRWMSGHADIVDDDDGTVTNGYVCMCVLPYSQRVFPFVGRDRSAASTSLAVAALMQEMGAVPEQIVLSNCRAAFKDGSVAAPISQVLSHFRLSLIDEGDALTETVRKEIKTICKHLDKEIKEGIYYSHGDLRMCLDSICSRYSDIRLPTGSTSSMIFEKEKNYMRPLPDTPFELYDERDCVIHYNLHVEYDGTFYSVPYQYYFGRHDLKLRVYACRVEIWSDGICVARHIRSSARYVTVPDHMPPKEILHKFEWHGYRIRSWARSIGPETASVIDRILERQAFEQHAYLRCITILQMGRKYGASNLEKACESVSDERITQAYTIIRQELQKGEKPL